MTTPQTTPELLAQRLRDACAAVRTKSYPLADLVPLMQQAADALSVRVTAAPQEGVSPWLIDLSKGLPEPLLKFDDWLNAPPSREVPEHPEGHAYRFDAYRRWEAAIKELRALARSAAAPQPPASALPLAVGVPKKYRPLVVASLMKLVTRVCAEFHDYCQLRNNWTGGEALKARKAYRATLDEIEEDLNLLAALPPGRGMVPMEEIPLKVNQLIGHARRLQGFANRLETTNALLSKEVRAVAYDVEKTAQGIYDSLGDHGIKEGS